MQYGIEKKYKWYIILRLIIVFSILFSGLIVLRRGIKFDFIPLLIIILMSIIINIIFFVILKKYTVKTVYLYTQLIFDNIIVFSIVYYTGGGNSVFSILYFINIISASFFLFVRGGIIISIFSIISYSLILFGEYYGILISPYNIVLNEHIMLESIIIKLYINSFAYIIIALISGYLSERIQANKVKLQDIINNLPSGILVFNSQYTIMDLNGKMKEIFPEVLLGKNLLNIDNPYLKNIRHIKYFQFEKNEHFFDVRVEKVAFKRKEENYLLIVNDITNLKDIEKKLVEKERLSVIGELSASIAHEIRNPLSSIKGAVKIIDEEFNDKIEKHPMFNIILEEIERLNHLINEFLNYSKQSSNIIEKIYILPLINKIIELLQIKDIVILKNINKETIIVSDQYKLRQILINLLKNAYDAINEKENPKITIEFTDTEKYYIIKIKDNGDGLYPEIEKRLFSPFNSNKKGGTGLGLAIVKKIIIEELNGSIKYKRENNETIFEIKLEKN